MHQAATAIPHSRTMKAPAPLSFEDLARAKSRFAVIFDEIGELRRR